MQLNEKLMEYFPGKVICHSDGNVVAAIQRCEKLFTIRTHLPVRCVAPYADTLVAAFLYFNYNRAVQDALGCFFCTYKLLSLL